MGVRCLDSGSISVLVMGAIFRRYVPGEWTALGCLICVYVIIDYVMLVRNNDVTAISICR